MSSFMSEFQHLRIPLQDIKSATDNFGENNAIGQGGFGKVYKGELLLSGVNTTVAIKRLDTKFGQGAPEFWKEIMFLSRYKHENLVSLLGFCDESPESLLVYEYLPNNSLDRYLSSTKLSWNQRLRICIGAANGLQYLHDPNGGHQRVLHRDIKSSNILLDQNWKPKISDFGLSRIGPANQQFTFLFSNAVGTMGYFDPLYFETGFLSKESDVYSFGVMLFEVLCGRLCVENYNGTRLFLAKLAKTCYEEKKLDTIINTAIQEQISPLCLQIFSKVAYQCLQRDPKERPSMAYIVNKLEIALQIQNDITIIKSLSITDEDEYWENKLPDDYQRYIEMSEEPLDYTTKMELYLLFCHGFLANNDNGQLWFSTCKLTRGICSILPATHVLFMDSRYDKLKTLSLSRFKEVRKLGTDPYYYLTCRLESFMFSPDHYTYACYLVFKFEDDHVLSNDGPIFTAYLNNCLIEVFANLDLTSVITKRVRKSWVEKRNDGWMEARLTKPLLKNHLENRENLRVELHKIEGGSLDGIIVEGVEFRPVVVVETSVKDNLIGTNLQHEEEYWEKKLPDDYQRHIEMSDEPLDYTTKKELYLLFCHGFLAHNDNGQLWFSTCKITRGLCSILPATDVLSKDSSYNNVETLSLSVSRFKEVRKLGTDKWYSFTCRLESFMFSRDHDTYACYLVFKFQDDHVLSNGGCIFGANLDDCYIYVFADLDSKSVITTRTLKPEGKIGSSSKSWVEKRNDGWMEARLTKPLLKHQLVNREELKVELYNFKRGNFDGAIVEGIEFRPEVVDGSYLVVGTSVKDNLIGTNLQAINDHEENKDGDEYWERKLPDGYQRHIEMSDEPLDYSTKKELYLLFGHGFLAHNDNGQLWFSTCKLARGLCSILPAKHVLSKDTNYKALETLSLSESRFKEVIKLRFYYSYVLTCRLESFMLSPDHYTYACYLVFKFEDDHVLSNDVPIFKADLNDCRIEVFANLDLTSARTIRTLKLEEDIGSSESIDGGLGMFKVYTGITERKSWVEKRNDGWMEARLINPLLKRPFENREELKIELRNGGSLNGIIVEGVEFRPVVVDGSCLVVETSIKDNLIGTQLQAIKDHEGDKDDDEYWEKKLPDDYQRHIEMSDEPLDYSTKKELYLLFCHGFLANNDNGQLWFSTCKLTGGLCSILPATHVLFMDSRYDKLKTLSLSESRFKEVRKLGTCICFELTCRLESFMFSRDHDTYACYLVFKFQDDYVLSNYGTIFEATLDNCYIAVVANLDSKSVITTQTLNEKTSWVEKRNDGWMEARLTKPLLKHHLENREELKVELFSFRRGKFDGIIVEGVEFRPVVVGGSCVETSIKDN